MQNALDLDLKLVPNSPQSVVCKPFPWPLPIIGHTGLAKTNLGFLSGWGVVVHGN